MEQVYKKRKFSKEEDENEDEDEYLEDLIAEFINNNSMSISDEEFDNEDFNTDEFESNTIVNSMNNNNCICTDPNCGGCDISKKKENKYIIDYWPEGYGYEAGYYLGEIQGDDIYYHPYLVIPQTYDVIGVYEDASGDVYGGVEKLENFIPISEEIAEHILKQGLELELWQKIDSE